METKKNISFRLLNIVTEQFATFEIENIPDANELKASIQFSINPDKRIIGCKINFQFFHIQQPFIVLTVICNFEIEENSWKEDIISKNKATFPKHLLDHLCVITAGTARGVLHAKTENTKFNKFIIPTLNVSNLVEKEVVFEIK